MSDIADMTKQLNEFNQLNDTPTAAQLLAAPKQMFYIATDGTLAIASGLYWDEANDRLGFGTDSPDTELHLSSSVSGSTVGPVIRLERNDTGISTGEIYGAIEFEGQDTTGEAHGVRGQIQGIAEGTAGQLGIRFLTRGSTTVALEERFRITSDIAGTGGIEIRRVADNDTARILSTEGVLDIRMLAPSGVTPFINIDPIPTDADSHSGFRFFRNVSTVGEAYIVVHSADGTNGSNTKLGANVDSYINSLVGGVAIGLKVLSAKLHVLGSSTTEPVAIFQAPASLTANVLELKNSGGAVMSAFSSVGNLGVGATSDALKKLYVYSYNNIASSIYGIDISARNDGTGSLYGLNITATGRDATKSTVAGMSAISYSHAASANSVITYLRGFSGRLGYTLSSTFDSTITNADAIVAVTPYSNVTGAGTLAITNAAGLRVDPQGSAYITNLYGIYVDDQENATSLNYALYTNAGKVRFGDEVETTSTMKATGYKSSDGSAGVTTTFDIANGDTVTVKNGLITGVA